MFKKNEKSPFRVAFPLSHTLRATCGTLPFNEHPQNPKNPCSNKRKVTLQSFISAEPHVASNVRYIAFPLSRPPQTRSPNLVSPLSCQKNQKYPQSIILHPNHPWSNFLAGDKDEKSSVSSRTRCLQSLNFYILTPFFGERNLESVVLWKWNYHWESQYPSFLLVQISKSPDSPKSPLPRS